jgi:hypothetical protein
MGGGGGGETVINPHMVGGEEEAAIWSSNPNTHTHRSSRKIVGFH